MSLNTKIEYLYRDASNYKQDNVCIINGVLTQKQIETILECCAGESFIPSKVGLPEKRFEKWTEDDHIWFEFDCWDECFSETTEPATVDITPEKLVEAFERCAGKWEENISFVLEDAFDRTNAEHVQGDYVSEVDDVEKDVVTGREIVVDKDKLDALVGYVHSLLEFIDVDDFEEEKNRSLVVDGFDEFVKPMMREDFVNPFTFVRNDEVQVFIEQLEDGWDVDASHLSFKEAKELYEKVQERFDGDSCGIYSNIVTDFVNEYRAANKLIDRDAVDKIISDAAQRSDKTDTGVTGKDDIIKD